MATKKRPQGGTNRSTGPQPGISAGSNRAPRNATTLGKAAKLSRAQGGGGPDSGTAQRLLKKLTGPQSGRSRKR